MSDEGMEIEIKQGPPVASCHCGAVSIALAAYPREVTECNCSLCRSHGLIWAYYTVDDVALPADARTDTYACNGRHVDFHRCSVCGCVTHWVPRDEHRSRRGINARLLPRAALERARWRHRDGENTGAYLD